MKCNYHTHSHFCDGKENMQLFVEKAHELNYQHLGFTSHAPICDKYDFTLTEEKIPEYLQEITKYQKQYLDLQIFKGLECDYIPEITKLFKYYKKTYKLDYIIGGVHLVKVPNSNEIWFIDGPKRETYTDGLKFFFKNNVKRAVTAFWEQTFEMIETQTFDIIAHLDKIKMHNQNEFFKEDETWYKKLVDKAIELIIKKNLIVEINSRGIYRLRCQDFYPSDYILQKLAQHNANMIISSDAHRADELPLLYEEAKQKLKSHGINHLVYLENKKWQPISF